MTRSSKFIEHMQEYLLTLHQNWEHAKNNDPLDENEYDHSDDYYLGATEATEHLLSVAIDIMEKSEGT